MSERDKLKHRKSGTIEVPADAFELMNWLSRVINESYDVSYGQPPYIELELTLRELNKNDD